MKKKVYTTPRIGTLFFHSPAMSDVTLKEELHIAEKIDNVPNIKRIEKVHTIPRIGTLSFPFPAMSDVTLKEGLHIAEKITNVPNIKRIEHNKKQNKGIDCFYPNSVRGKCFIILDQLLWMLGIIYTLCSDISHLLLE
jgi:hypothetical protein